RRPHGVCRRRRSHGRRHEAVCLQNDRRRPDVVLDRQRFVRGAPVKTVTEDVRNPRLLFAGTEFGLYWSLDGGQHWSFPGGGLPHVMVDRVVVNERTNDLVLGTHGRSVMILDDIAPLQGWDSAEPAQLFPIRDATEIYQWRD